MGSVMRRLRNGKDRGRYSRAPEVRQMGDEQQSQQSRHVDDFIDDPETDDYAAFWLDLFRQSPERKERFGKFTQQFKLFCVHGGKRYRVTGASRLGDVWLSADFNRGSGYEKRVDVDSCSAWGPTP